MSGPQGSMDNSEIWDDTSEKEQIGEMVTNLTTDKTHEQLKISLSASHYCQILQ